jgi:hypothetical protein
METPTHTRATWLLAALALLAVTAAQAAEPALQPAQRVSPCKLLLEQDVKSALGGSWQVWEDMGSEEVCVFQASPTSMVTVTLHHDPMGAEKILEVRRQLAGEGAKPVAGLGAGAFRLQMSSANSIVFGKGQTVVRIEMSNAASTDTALLERLAQAAYSRMP